jgi:hypothetical protein
MINRSPTPIEIVSATTTRRDVFATMPAGLVAVDNSVIAVEDTFSVTNHAPRASRATARCDERRIPAMNRKNSGLNPWLGGRDSGAKGTAGMSVDCASRVVN